MKKNYFGTITIIRQEIVRHPRHVWLEMDISDLGGIFDLSVRCHSALRRIGVNNLSDLLKFTEKELMSKKPESGDKVGPKSLEEIKRMLDRLGMSFKG